MSLQGMRETMPMSGDGEAEGFGGYLGLGGGESGERGEAALGRHHGGAGGGEGLHGGAGTLPWGGHEGTGYVVGDGVDPAVAEARHRGVDYAGVGAVDADAAVADAFGEEGCCPCEYLLAASVVVKPLCEIGRIDCLAGEVAAWQGESSHQRRCNHHACSLAQLGEQSEGKCQSGDAVDLQ